MRYPIVIEQGSKTTAFGVIVPDLEGLLNNNMDIPHASPIEDHKSNPDFAGYIWAIVEIDLAKLSSTSKRYNITMPERVMDMIDHAAKAAGESRSGYLAQAAIARMSD